MSAAQVLELSRLMQRPVRLIGRQRTTQPAIRFRELWYGRGAARSEWIGVQKNLVQRRFDVQSLLDLRLSRRLFVRLPRPARRRAGIAVCAIETRKVDGG